MKTLLSELKLKYTVTAILALIVVAIGLAVPGAVGAIKAPAGASLASFPGTGWSGTPTQVAFFTSTTDIGSDSNLYWDNVNKRLGIGTTSPEAPCYILSTSMGAPFTIDQSGTGGPLTALYNNWSDQGPTSGAGFLARFARGTKASPVNVQSGDRLGFNVFGGWVGSWVHTAAIEALVGTGTVSSTSLPTWLKFSTTPDGSTTRVERMRITPGGSVGIGGAGPTNGRLDVETPSGNAVWGNSTSGVGVYGNSTDGTGVAGYSTSGVGVYGYSGNYAGYFDGNVRVNGNQTVTGTKSFVMDDPTDPTREIYYASLEGPEAGTYQRGSAALVAGEVVIELPDYFAKVTADEGLTVQLTPVGKWLQLYVVEKSTARIIVREATGQSGSFDYLVNGIRKGYENFQVIRDRSASPAGDEVKK